MEPSYLENLKIRVEEAQSTASLESSLQIISGSFKVEEELDYFAQSFSKRINIFNDTLITTPTTFSEDLA
jgi:hypothetical protein